jgi:hypothetical protein
LILDDKGIPNQKHQINDYGKDMEMNYIPIKEKKDKRTIETSSLKIQMKQTKPKKKP